MADFVFNSMKGEFKTLAALPAANDGLIVSFVETTGLEAQMDAQRGQDQQASIGESSRYPAQSRATVSMSASIGKGLCSTASAPSRSVSCIACS